MAAEAEVNELRLAAAPAVDDEAAVEEEVAPDVKTVGMGTLIIDCWRMGSEASCEAFRYEPAKSDWSKPPPPP